MLKCRVLKNIVKKFLKTDLAKLINLYRVQHGDLIHFDYFKFWQKKGFHITPNHYYSPIPDTSVLKPKDFAKKTMVGIDFNDKYQIGLLNKLSKFKSEFMLFKKINNNIDNQKDPSFYFGNLAFDGIDALSYYGLIRLLKPKKIIEIGSGWSTKIAARASLENKTTQLYSVEPYPQPVLKKGFPGFKKLIEKKVEDVNLDFFQSLESGDILFIDSSHVVRIGGDVNYIFFEILPRLKKGVYVHFHDIFFPYEYPEEWLVKEYRFWSEQYLLHAFMLFNDTFEVVFSKGYLGDKYPKLLQRTFIGFSPRGGGSFWVRKIK